MFNEEIVFNSKIKDLIDNLIYSTLEEIATLVRIVELLSIRS